MCMLGGMKKPTEATDAEATGNPVIPEPKPPQKRMIQRLTLDYSTREDRLQIRAIDAEGKVLVLWLTQRLCNMLVKAVIGILDQTVPPQSQVGTNAPRSVPVPTQKGASQYLEQTRADLTKVPSPTVQVPNESEDVEDVLIDSIQLKRSRQTYLLNLDWGVDAVALPMVEPELRQFMRAMHNRYRSAGWPMSGLWPDWFSDTAHQTYVESSLIN